MYRTCGVVTTVACVCAPAVAHAVEPLTGPEVVDVVRSNADVMRVHQWFMRTAMDVDSAPGYVSDGIARYMPGKFRTSNGQVFNGTLVRITGTSSGGWGQPRTGRALFGGFSGDVALVDAASGGYRAQNIDGFFFFGGSYHGVMATVGVRFISGWTNLDAAHRFTFGSSGPQVLFRPGTPDEVTRTESTEALRPKQWAAPLLNIHHAEGATLGGAFEVVERQLPDGTYTAGRTLSALRGLLEPEPWIRRIGARYLGVPLVGLERYAAGVDRWGEHGKEARIAHNEGRTPPPSSDKAQYEIPFGADDVMSTGLRLVGIVAVYPQSFLREVEAAWAYSTGPLEAGAKAFVFRRSGKYETAAEAFAAWAPGPYFRIALSYSYNVPETTTFFPIPNASVFGMQFTFGDNRFARPIVPLLACAKANRARVQAIKNSKCEDGTGVQGSSREEEP